MGSSWRLPEFEGVVASAKPLLYKEEVKRSEEVLGVSKAFKN